MDKDNFECISCKNTTCKVITVEEVGECLQCDECKDIWKDVICPKCGNPTAIVSTGSAGGGICLVCTECTHDTIVKPDDPEKIAAWKREQLIPKCPQCGSTAITATTEMYVAFGAGSSKPVNYCMSCGCKWRPHG